VGKANVSREIDSQSKQKIMSFRGQSSLIKMTRWGKLIE
jgi:hypothetical protein